MVLFLSIFQLIWVQGVVCGVDGITDVVNFHCSVIVLIFVVVVLVEVSGGVVVVGHCSVDVDVGDAVEDITDVDH